MTEIVIFMIICTACIAVMVLRKWLCIKRRCNKAGYIVIPCSSKTKNLEKTVRAYYWEEIFENENLGREILLVLMEQSENDYTAKRLASELSIVSVVDVTDLADYMKKSVFSCRDKNISE